MLDQSNKYSNSKRKLTEFFFLDKLSRSKFDTKIKKIKLAETKLTDFFNKFNRSLSLKSNKINKYKIS